MTGNENRFAMRQVGRLAPGVRRGLFVAGLAVAVLVTGLPASANTPETGLDPSVTVNVTPSDNVFDGQAVTVTGTGWPAYADGVIRQCGGTVAAPQCDVTISGLFKVGAAPVIPTTLVVVKRYVHTATTTFNCGVEACALVVTAGGKTSQHHISILGAGTSIPDGSSTVPTTVPTTFVPTTVPTTFVPTTFVPTTVPTTFVPTTIPQIGGLLCSILHGLRDILGGLLSGIVDGLLMLFGCSPTG